MVWELKITKKFSKNKADAVSFASAHPKIFQEVLRLTTIIEVLRLEASSALGVTKDCPILKTILSSCVVLQVTANDILGSLRLKIENEQDAVGAENNHIEQNSSSNSR